MAIQQNLCRIYLDQHVGVKYHEIILHVYWNLDTFLAKFLVHVEQDVVCVPILTGILLLSGNYDGRSSCLWVLLQRHV